jgi:two-component system, cell cycle response regulator
MRILIAEDDPVLRRLLRAKLAEAGHELVEAADGEQAWELVQRERIRLLLVDWMMPRLDGPELIRRIRAAGWPGYTYVILLTARSGRNDVVDGLNLGADDYLTKPFRHDELLARLGVGIRILELEARLGESLAREEALATRDLLTGLLNRRATFERARAEVSRAGREGTRLGLVLVDLDQFQRINEQFGQEAGDQALRRVAEVLQQNLRDFDFVGRWGGEEFLVVLPGASLEQAAQVAERVRASMAAAHVRRGGSDAAELRVSAGVTSSSASPRPVTLDELLQQADAALYRAKAAGRNRVAVHEPAPG